MDKINITRDEIFDVIADLYQKYGYAGLVYGLNQWTDYEFDVNHTVENREVNSYDEEGNKIDSFNFTGRLFHLALMNEDGESASYLIENNDCVYREKDESDLFERYFNIETKDAALSVIASRRYESQVNNWTR